MNRVGISFSALVTICFATVAVTREVGTRERLIEAAKVSRQLREKAGDLPDGMAKTLGMMADAPEERTVGAEKPFALKSTIEVYKVARPWTAAYNVRRRMSAEPPAVWPTLPDADSLRDLLTDRDAAVRGLAAEALATLHQPEDVPRIAALLKDQATGALALGWSWQMSSMAWSPQDRADPNADPYIPERTWHERTVQTYAREALRLMTGHRFDGLDPRGIPFEEWWRTHDLGKDSLWYWQQRLRRDRLALLAVAPGPWDSDDNRRESSSAALEVRKRHKDLVAEIGTMPPETRAKIFLMATEDFADVTTTGPINRFFPEGIVLPIEGPRVMELVGEGWMWEDCADVARGRALLLGRLARMASEKLVRVDDQDAFHERLRTALKREARGQRWMPVLVARLLPAALTPEELDDPRTSEGFLRASLAEAKEGAARSELAREMVRANLEGQWPVLEKVFYSEELKRGETSDAREGILEALGETPHSPKKRAVLAGLIDDPRNEELLTQPNRRMGMDMYRRCAVNAANAIAGHEAVSRDIRQDLSATERSRQALEEFRRIVRGLKAPE